MYICYNGILLYVSTNKYMSAPFSLQNFIKRWRDFFAFLHKSGQKFQCFIKINFTSQPWNISFFPRGKGLLLFNINRTKYFLVLHQMLTSSSKPWNISTQSIQHQYASLLSTCCCLLWSFVAKISLATSLARLSLHKF